MRVAGADDELVALQGSSVADTLHGQGLGITVGNTDDHVVDQAAG